MYILYPTLLDIVVHALVPHAYSSKPQVPMSSTPRGVRIDGVGTEDPNSPNPQSVLILPLNS